MCPHDTDPPRDELTTTVLSVIEALPAERKAGLLLEHALALIESGRYGHEVEGFLDIYLRTPGLPSDDVAKALVARGKARQNAAQLLLMRAELDFRTASSVDPSNREVQVQLRRDRIIRPADTPASQRLPPEVWDRIASHVPRFFLRTWLSVSSFFRAIASRHLFRTLDLFLGDEPENLPRTMDVLDRVRADPVFARRVRRLRLHWALEDGELLDLMLRIVRNALPGFTALQAFEWVGYPELKEDMVTALLRAHPNLTQLGCIGWHFDAVGVSSFRRLERFTLRAEDDDGEADMAEVRSALDAGSQSLTHLTLGASLARPHSWDDAFRSPTIAHLSVLELVDTRISHAVLTRILACTALAELTLHGTLDTDAADAARSLLYASNLLPNLTSLRIALAGHDEDTLLQNALARALVRGRTRLSRLDLDGCPSELLLGLLPGLKGLRALRVRISLLSERARNALVEALPADMRALHVASVVSTVPMHEHAPAFARFASLSFLHLHGGAHARQRRGYGMGEAAAVARAVPSADFLGWHGEHFVVLRGPRLELKELPVRKRLDCGRGVDLGSEDAMWVERKDVPVDYDVET